MKNKCSTIKIILGNSTYDIVVDNIKNKTEFTREVNFILEQENHGLFFYNIARMDEHDLLVFKQTRQVRFEVAFKLVKTIVKLLSQGRYGSVRENQLWLQLQDIIYKTPLIRHGYYLKSTTYSLAQRVSVVVDDIAYEKPLPDFKDTQSVEVESILENIKYEVDHVKTDTVSHIFYFVVDEEVKGLETKLIRHGYSCEIDYNELVKEYRSENVGYDFIEVSKLV